MLASLLKLFRKDETLAELMRRRSVERLRAQPMLELPAPLAHIVGADQERPLRIDGISGTCLCGDCGISNIFPNGRCVGCGGTSWVPAGRGKIIHYNDRDGLCLLPAPSVNPYIQAEKRAADVHDTSVDEFKFSWSPRADPIRETV